MSRDLLRTIAAISLGVALGGFEAAPLTAQESVPDVPPAANEPLPPVVEEPGPPIEAEMEQAPGERDALPPAPAESPEVTEPGEVPAGAEPGEAPADTEPGAPAAPLQLQPGPPIPAELQQAPGERDVQTDVYIPGRDSAPPLDVVESSVHDGTLFWTGPIAPSNFDEAYFYGYDLPAWKLSAETLFLNRTDATSSSPFISRMQNVQTGAVVTNKVQDLDFNFEPGIRLLLTKAITDGSSYIEMGYLGLFHWNAQNTYYSDPNGFRITQGDVFFALSEVDSQIAAYSNNLHSAEINIRTDICYYPFSSILMGIRYMHLDEAYVLREFGSDQVPGVANLVEATDFRRLSTENEMLGFQAGGNASLPLGEYLTIGMAGKAGAYVNWARVNTNQNLTVNIDNVTPIIRSTYYDGRNIAGVLEGNMFVSVQLTSNWRIYGGYQLLFMLSTALAPEQPFPQVLVTDNSTTTIDYPGHVLYHGPFLGTEITWGSCNH